MTPLKAFQGLVDDAWIERWSEEIASKCGGEDRCYAAFRVTITLTREEARKLVGEENFKRLEERPPPPARGMVTTDDLPHNGQRWALVRISH